MQEAQRTPNSSLCEALAYDTIALLDVKRGFAVARRPSPKQCGPCTCATCKIFCVYRARGLRHIGAWPLAVDSLDA